MQIESMYGIVVHSACDAAQVSLDLGCAAGSAKDFAAAELPEKVRPYKDTVPSHCISESSEDINLATANAAHDSAMTTVSVKVLEEQLQAALDKANVAHSLQLSLEGTFGEECAAHLGGFAQGTRSSPNTHAARPRFGASSG